MFKKPLSNLKTAAPIRTSDRRRLKQKIVSLFSLSSQDGDLLVPEGIQVIKFKTHLGEPGVAYLSPDGADPLWFTIGKDAEDDYIPSVYTLWKHKNLLHIVSTPPAVIPILVGGADLMIPGVVHHSPSLQQNQLVSICQYNHQTNDPNNPTLSPPLAVGKMALSSDALDAKTQEKGKAVIVYHTWKDNLWDMGSKPTVPENAPFNSPLETQESSGDKDEALEDANLAAPEEQPTTSKPAPVTVPSTPAFSPEDISYLLVSSLTQAVQTILRSLPPSSFPIPSTLFFTTYVLPFRPAFPRLPTSATTDKGDEGGGDNDEEVQAPSITPQDITIKNSSHKSLSAFLKNAEKSHSLLTLKPAPKHSQFDLLVTGVNLASPAVESHIPHVTVKEVEERAAKRAAREAAEAQAGGGGSKSSQGREVQVKELYKPHGASVALIEGLGGRTDHLYTPAEISALVNTYVASNNLVNPNHGAYINPDAFITDFLEGPARKTSSAPKKNASNGGMKGSTSTGGSTGGNNFQEAIDSVLGNEFVKRDELVRKVVEQMQAWYELTVKGEEPIRKKGTPKPISVATKIRQGRKHCTLVTGFEPFFVIDAEEMAEELRKRCAGATSVNNFPGPGVHYASEVYIQGKQSKAAVAYLMEKGIPKKWIEETGK